MEQSRLLGVILKAIGIWALVGGIASLPQAVGFSHWYPDEQAFLLMMADTFAGPTILMLSSWFLLRSTDWFVRIAYPASISTEANATNDESAPELFGVLLKAIGYWEILNGIVRLPYDLARDHRATEVRINGYSVAYSGIGIVAGCFLVFATGWFVRFAYRKTAAIDENETHDEVPPQPLQA